jgi:hypothetical protein
MNKERKNENKQKTKKKFSTSMFMLHVCGRPLLNTTLDIHDSDFPSESDTVFKVDIDGNRSKNEAD